MLVVELLAVTIRFDSGSVSSNGSALSWFVSNSANIPQLFAVMIAATMIFGTHQTFAAWQVAVSAVKAARFRASSLFLHLCCFVGFWLSCEQVFVNANSIDNRVLTVWIVFAIGCFLTWLDALVPLPQWGGVIKSFGPTAAVVFLIGLVGWLGGRLASTYWMPLASCTTTLVKSALSTLGIALSDYESPYVVGTESFAVNIAPECSGYEGIGLAAVFMATYLWWCRDQHRFPQSLLLFPLVLGVMFISNAIRITALILLGHYGWPEFATGGFHSQAGWFAFNAIVVSAVFLARRMSFFSACASERPASSSGLALPYLLPFLVLTLTVIGCDAIAPSSLWGYPIRIACVGLVIFLFWGRYDFASIWTSSWWFPALTGLVAFLIWMAFERFAQPAEPEFAEMLYELPALSFYAWLAVRVLGSVIVIPIAEELAFRGYLIPWFNCSLEESNGAKPSWWATVATSLAFGLLHPGRIVAATLAGLLYGVTYRRRGSVVDSILSHSVTNGLIAIYVFATFQWSLWS